MAWIGSSGNANGDDIMHFVSRPQRNSPPNSRCGPGNGETLLSAPRHVLCLSLGNPAPCRPVGMDSITLSPSNLPVSIEIRCPTGRQSGEFKSPGNYRNGVSQSQAQCAEENNRFGIRLRSPNRTPANVRLWLTGHRLRGGLSRIHYCREKASFQRERR